MSADPVNNQPLNLLVLGGTGNVGKHVIESALKKGYKVRSLTRSLKKVPKFKEGEVEWIEGSVLDQATVDKVVQGQDAVISVLGPKGTGKTELYSESAKNVVTAMKNHNVNRYLVITPGTSTPQQGFLIKWLLSKVLKNLRANSKVMEDYFTSLNDPNINWTIVRPFPMKNGTTGKYRVGAGDASTLTPPLKTTTHRGDLADFLVTEATENKWKNQIVTLGL